MFTFFIVILLVAGICFVLGQGFERARIAREDILRMEEEQDAAVFAEWQQATPGLDLWRKAAPGLDSWNLPKLHVIHDADVDAHFDELCRLGLVEQA